MTMGHSRGIGPEVIVRTLSEPSIRRLADFLVIGDLGCMKKIRSVLKVRIPFHKVDLWEIISSKDAIFKKDANPGLVPPI